MARFQGLQENGAVSKFTHDKTPPPLFTQCMFDHINLQLPGKNFFGIFFDKKLIYYGLKEGNVSNEEKQSWKEGGGVTTPISLREAIT